MTDAELPSQLSLDDALAENPFAMEKPSDQEKFKSAFGVDTNESEDAKDDSKNDEKTDKQSGTENKKDVRAKKFGSARMDEEPNLKERSSRDLGSSRRQRSRSRDRNNRRRGRSRSRTPPRRSRSDRRRSRDRSRRSRSRNRTRNNDRSRARRSPDRKKSMSPERKELIKATNKDTKEIAKVSRMFGEAMGKISSSPKSAKPANKTPIKERMISAAGKNSKPSSETEDVKVSIDETRQLEKWSNSKEEMAQLNPIMKRMGILKEEIDSGNGPDASSNKLKTVDAVKAVQNKAKAGIESAERVMNSAKDKLRGIQEDRWDPKQSLHLV